MESNMFDYYRPINLFILSDSLEYDIKNGNELIKKIDNLSSFDEINVCFIDSKSPILNEFIENNFKSQISKMYISNELLCLEMLNHRFVFGIANDITNNLIDKTNISNRDLQLIENEEVDYLIVCDEDSRFLKHDKIKSPTQIMEIVRLFMLKNEKYKVRNNYSIDSTYYYLYRYKKVFYEFQRVWNWLIEIDNQFNSNELLDFGVSLYTRLDFYCRSSDFVKIHSLMKQNNTNASHMLYHMSYMAILMTGTFDNIAWIIKYLYNLELDKMEIVLKSTSKNKFKKALSNIDIALSEYIFSEETQNIINLIYPLRDQTVHGQFLSSVRYGNTKRNMIRFTKIDSFSSDLFSKFNCIIRIDNDTFIDPFEFVDILSNLYIEVINGILSRIAFDVTDYKIEDNALLKLEELSKNYSKGLHNFLSLKVEPIYF